MTERSPDWTGAESRGLSLRPRTVGSLEVWMIRTLGDSRGTDGRWFTEDLAPLANVPILKVASGRDPQSGQSGLSPVCASVM